MARRGASGIATVFVVPIVVFLATEVLPGNAAYAVLGHTATPRGAARRAVADAGRAGGGDTEFLGRDRYQRAAACEDAPARLAERIPAGHREDDRRAGDPGPAEATRHHRGVRIPAVWQPA